jgi:hypothetical protein
MNPQSSNAIENQEKRGWSDVQWINSLAGFCLTPLCGAQD